MNEDESRSYDDAIAQSLGIDPAEAFAKETVLVAECPPWCDGEHPPIICEYEPAIAHETGASVVEIPDGGPGGPIVKVWLGVRATQFQHETTPAEMFIYHEREFHAAPEDGQRLTDAYAKVLDDVKAARIAEG